MELLEVIKTRRSVREFTGQRIPDEHIEMILDAARYAPSPENLQMWRYVVIREDQEMKDQQSLRTYGMVLCSCTQNTLIQS